MSSYYYYKSHGYRFVEPKHRKIQNANVANTATIWTPTTGARIAVTGIAINANNPGSIAFYFSNTTNLSHESKIAEFMMDGSSTIVSTLSSWESTVADALLVARVSSGLTDHWTVTAEGFELDV